MARLLTRRERARAIRIADARLHGYTEKQCKANPELLMPDGVVDLLDRHSHSIDSAYELEVFNSALCKAQCRKDDKHFRRKCQQCEYRKKQGIEVE